jgi:predicted MFS family arabinose efflux permease
VLAIDARGRSRRLAMLVALSGGALLATITTIGITPFLLAIAADLNTDLAAAGNLVALQSITWGIASLFAALGLAIVAVGNLVGNLLGGHLSDRLPAPQAVLAITTWLLPRELARLLVARSEH